MYNEISKLILFRPGEASLLWRVARLGLSVEQGADAVTCRAEFCALVSELAGFAAGLGLEGDLWHAYLTHFLLTHENPFTLSRERRAGEDSLGLIARGDLAVFKKLFDYDFSAIRAYTGVNAAELTRDWRALPGLAPRGDMGCTVMDLAPQLAAAEDAEALYAALCAHYAAYGVGELGMNRFFRLDTACGLELKPVANADRVVLDDLVGYELQKAELRRNTLAFLQGRPANNVLLYGDSGSGKSTSVKAIVNEYYPAGLRLVEIYKHQFRELADLIASVKDKNYKFIIFIDDLSFDDTEFEYKSLKAVIEGGVEAKPDNVLIYATSNRRHLVKENWEDRADMTHTGGIHHSDTVEEKLSLASRFGVALNYSSPDRQQYHEIVKTLAERAGITMEEEQLYRRADAWEIRHGGVSGRTAQQFINYLVCGE